MIRLILVLLFVFLFLVLSTPLMLIEWIIGKFNQPVKDRSSLAIVNWAFRWVIRLSGTKIIVKGEENVPQDTAVLYVGNHRSYYDIILTYVSAPAHRLCGQAGDAAVSPAQCVDVFSPLPVSGPQ